MLINRPEHNQAGLGRRGIMRAPIAAALSCVLWTAAVAADEAGAEAPAGEGGAGGATADGADKNPGVSGADTVAQVAPIVSVAIGSRCEVHLQSGALVRGSLAKRTATRVFVDIGFTIIELPLVQVREINDLSDDEATENARARQTVQADSIFFGARLQPGTIESKAREVGEAVVQIQCLGKLGSGFIINKREGYVVTNFHVVEREQDISVVLYVSEQSGFRKVKTDQVKIIALNSFFDLALLQIQDTKGVELKQCYLGDYARVRVGDPVFAVGSPLGLERSVSEGIVSNRNRALSGYLLIQTTAPINPGNSGGPLFNQRGEVIGVTSLKIRGGESLGFAIPIHYVKDFLRHRDAFSFDKDNPNTGIRYLAPPPKSPVETTGQAAGAASSAETDQRGL